MFFPPPVFVILDILRTVFVYVVAEAECCLRAESVHKIAAGLGRYVFEESRAAFEDVFRAMRAGAHRFFQASVAWKKHAVFDQNKPVNAVDDLLGEVRTHISVGRGHAVEKIILVELQVCVETADLLFAFVLGIFRNSADQRRYLLVVGKENARLYIGVARRLASAHGGFAQKRFRLVFDIEISACIGAKSRNDFGKLVLCGQFGIFFVGYDGSGVNVRIGACRAFCDRTAQNERDDAVFPLKIPDEFFYGFRVMLKHNFTPFFSYYSFFAA